MLIAQLFQLAAQHLDQHPQPASWGGIAVTGVISTVPTSMDAVTAIEAAARLESGSHAIAHRCGTFDEYAADVRDSDGVPFVGLAATTVYTER